MRWNTGKYTIIEVHRAQELEPVEQPVRRGGVIARLNPAQPDEAADRPRQHLGSQSVEPITGDGIERSEEHTSELQSLMRISYAVFCLQKKKKQQTKHVPP